MDLPIPSPKHINPNHPFCLSAFGKNVVDGKNVTQNFNRISEIYGMLDVAELQWLNSGINLDYKLLDYKEFESQKSMYSVRCTLDI